MSLFWRDIFPAKRERVPLSVDESEKFVRVELMRITRIERFPDDRALCNSARNEFHDGDRRNIKKWMEKRWKKREKEKRAGELAYLVSSSQWK